jgi:hypothetical protein
MNGNPPIGGILYRLTGWDYTITLNFQTNGHRCGRRYFEFKDGVGTQTMQLKALRNDWSLWISNCTTTCLVSRSPRRRRKMADDLEEGDGDDGEGYSE